MEDNYVYQDATDTLINKLNIKDPGQLKQAEDRFYTANAQAAEDIALQAKKIDFQIFKEVHRTLFEDLYGWAGKHRTCNMSKAGFLFCRPEFIESEVNKAFSSLQRQNYFAGSGRDEYCRKMATLFGDLNTIHPFREGNGRAQKLLMSGVAAKAGYLMDWNKISREEHIAAVIAERNGEPAALEMVFNKGLTPIVEITQGKAYNIDSTAIKPSTLRSMPMANEVETLQSTVEKVQQHQVLLAYDRNFNKTLDELNVSRSQIKALETTIEGRRQSITAAVKEAFKEPEKVLDALEAKKNKNGQMNVTAYFKQAEALIKEPEKFGALKGTGQLIIDGLKNQKTVQYLGTEAKERSERSVEARKIGERLGKDSEHIRNTALRFGLLGEFQEFIKAQTAEDKSKTGFIRSYEKARAEMGDALVKADPNTVKAVEKNISDKLGREFKIDDAKQPGKAFEVLQKAVTKEYTKGKTK